MASAVFRFARVVIIARVLTPEDFGVAATFWITTGVLMAVTELGLEKIIIQDDRGDESHFGAVAQLLLVLRGILLSVIILVFAGDIAQFFDVPEASDEFRLLALIPLMTGFLHRDIIRLQRKMDFKPFVLSTVVPEFLIVLMAYPVAVYFQDYRAFVYLALLSVFCRLIVSFRLAERPFLLAWDSSVFYKAWKFGWPLMINGILMLLTMQGDKIIISQYYTKQELGFFAIAFGFATMVPNSLGAVTTQVVLPYLSRLKEDKSRLELNLGYFCNVVLWLSISAICVLVFHGEMITTIVYGDRYLDAAVLIKVITVVFFIRLLRQLPNTLAIVYAQTWMVMVSNVIRQFSLMLALILAISGEELVWVASTGLAGEVLALITITILHHRLHRHSAILWIKPLGILLLTALSLFYLVAEFNEREYILLYLPVSIAVVLTSMFMIRRLLNEQVKLQG